MIYIERSLYNYYKEQGIYLPENETIILPDHRTKRELVEFAPLRMTKRRKAMQAEEKKRAEAYDLGYDKLREEYGNN